MNILLLKKAINTIYLGLKGKHDAPIAIVRKNFNNF